MDWVDLACDRVVVTRIQMFNPEHSTGKARDD